MINLEPGKIKYRYRVGGYDPVNQIIKKSNEFSFVTAPIPSPEEKTTIAMLGDQVILLSSLTVYDLFMIYFIYF